MSALESESRVKSKNVIQYASDQINNPMLEDKDTITGIKTIIAVEKKVKEAILLHETEKEMSHWGR